MKYLVNGLSRSGHHAIINWISLNFEAQEEPVNFYNNCTEGWREKLLIPKSYPQGIHVYNKKDARSACHFIFSLEAFNIDHYFTMGFQEFSIDKNIIILRDHFNWMASLVKGGHKITNELLGLWKSHAKGFLHGRSLPNQINISYNAWASDEGYRMGTADRLGFKNLGLGLEDVPHFGGGSSFNGMAADGIASKMDVLNRFDDEKVREDESFLKYANDLEAKNLTHDIFGMISPIIK
jgi:hypothetical protein